MVKDFSMSSRYWRIVFNMFHSYYFACPRQQIVKYIKKSVGTVVNYLPSGIAKHLCMDN